MMSLRYRRHSQAAHMQAQSGDVWGGQSAVGRTNHTGRALHTQLEGNRSSDRGLSDAAVALSD